MTSTICMTAFGQLFAWRNFGQLFAWRRLGQLFPWWRFGQLFPWRSCGHIYIWPKWVMELLDMGSVAGLNGHQLRWLVAQGGCTSVHSCHFSRWSCYHRAAFFGLMIEIDQRDNTTLLLAWACCAGATGKGCCSRLATQYPAFTRARTYDGRGQRDDMVRRSEWQRRTQMDGSTLTTIIITGDWQ